MTERPAGLDDLLDYVADNLADGIRRAGPSPEEIDARLRELLPEGQLLAFYQWIGAMAVTEALDDLRENLSNDPREPHGQHYHRDDVEEMLDIANPTESSPYPTKLPPGRPFCDLPHHAHPNGAGRLSTCRLDAEDST